MENFDLLWFSSHIHHLKTHVVQRVVVSVSLEAKKKSVSCSKNKYIFKVMMTIFKLYFPPVNHCRAKERRLHCSQTVLVQAFKPLCKLK